MLLLLLMFLLFFFFFSSRRRHTRFDCDWSSDVCSSDLSSSMSSFPVLSDHDYLNFVGAIRHRGANESTHVAEVRYPVQRAGDRKSTRLNSSHSQISYAVFCLKKKKNDKKTMRASTDRAT